MNSSCSFLWMLALLQQFLASDIYLDVNGVDHPSCLHGIGACKTFEFLANHSSYLSDHTVCINSSILYLTNRIIFLNLKNLSFVGGGEGTTLLSCPTGENTEAGIHFHCSLYIALIGFSVQECSAKKVGYNISAAIVFDSCKYVTIFDVSISKSRGYGLVLNNCLGITHIKDSSFIYNRYSSLSATPCQTFDSGGVYISVSSSSDSQYIIYNCTFLHNTAISQQIPGEDSQTGGGFKISFFHNATNNMVELTNCLFTNNSAHHGGGIHFLFSTGSFSNSVQVKNTWFISNSASEMGAGVDAAYLRASSCDSNSSPDSCNLNFTNCTFTNNVAKSGGGVSIYGALDRRNNLRNKITFQGSNWNSNIASSGSAVDVSIDRYHSDYTATNFIVLVVLLQCRFSSNMPLAASSSQLQTGVVSTSEVAIQFQQFVEFSRNEMTALYAMSAHIIFNKSTTANFFGNMGSNGGAIFLSGDSSILYQGNVKFDFTNNSALVGGAIYALPLLTHYLAYTDVCFLIQISNQSLAHSSFAFKDNNAFTGVGNDIFVSSLNPCLGLCSVHHPQILDVGTELPDSYFTANCTGNFSSTPDYATNPTNVSVNLGSLLSPQLNLFPGIAQSFNIVQIDEGGHNVSKIFPLAVKVYSNNNISVHPNYMVTTDGITKLRGPLGVTGTLIFQTSALNAMSASVPFRFHANCPPGFVLSEGNECTCHKKDGSVAYTGIAYCEKDVANLTLGYWAGYVNNTVNDSRQVFVTAVCAVELCSFANSQSKNQYPLPPEVNGLSDFICSDNRTGTLCGKCKSGHSTYYHSPSFACGNAAGGCSFGIPLYFVLELLPVTAMFLVILLFNINLTSGPLYSFVFFAQFLDSLFIDAYGLIDVQSKWMRLVVNVLQAIYGLFNLNIQFLFVSWKKHL